MLRADLHVVSRYSDQPSEWILRKLGIPESYSEPLTLYRLLDQKGMTLKTITDLNKIQGGLEIAHYPDVFLSEEVSTQFPDGGKVSLLVWHLNEAQHQEIQSLRSNIFELSAYLREQKLSHAVAHPFVDPNRSLTLDHIEKLFLLFRHFQTINANREPLAQEILGLCLQALTKEKIEEMANRHNLEPPHENAHEKKGIGGSEDRRGQTAGDAYTEAPTAQSLEDFFCALEKGSIAAKGRKGNPLRFSSSIYTTIFHYAQAQIQAQAPRSAQLLQSMAERFLAGKNPAAFSLQERIGHVTEAIRTGKAFDFFKPGESTLAREIGAFFSDPQVKQALDNIIDKEPEAERRSFRMASYLTNQLSYRLGQQFLARLGRGRLLDAFQSLAGLLPVGGAVLPYFWAFHQQSPHRTLLQQTSHHFLRQMPPPLRNQKRAWFTDTLEDVNGVAHTIHMMAKEACLAQADLTVVTSRREISIQDIPIQNFTPVGEFEIPEYKLQKLSWPPFLEIIDYLQREGFTELIISTPGPIGLCALASAKLLGIPTSGIYHTDFPQYARFLSDDAFIETMTWSYMQWFYGQLDLIYSNSEFYRQRWIERGIPSDKVKIFPRGLNTESFHPKFHDKTFWPQQGADYPVLLYVGRISKEKELGFLAQVLRLLKKKGCLLTPAFVGEGPYQQELQAQLPEAIFTGVLRGNALSTAYASADLFAFPSTTDTFGNVVIEAMASGLPVAVSDQGGPCELVRQPEQGHIFPAKQIEAWVEGLASMLKHLPSPQERQTLAQKTHQERNWAHAFKTFWTLSP